MTHDDWRAEHNTFLDTVQDEDIRERYVAALNGDQDQAARQKLTTIVEVAWAPSNTWTPREREAARAIRLLFVHAGTRRKNEKVGQRAGND